MDNLNFTKKEPITKGMAGDKKYYIETADGKRLLLRVADISDYARKKSEFETVQKGAAIGIPLPQPVYFGISEDGKSVYTLLTWIDGDEVETILPTLSKTEQYTLGLKSGAILRKIHNIPTSKETEDWVVRYFAVMDERLNAFRSEGVAFHGDSVILKYLDANRYLLKGRPQCCHHGDYHEGNMILSKEGELSVIDWHTVDFDNYGDPWYEFNRIGCAFPAFASGQINGYFNNKPPEEFWRLLAYYLSASAITSIVWAKYFAPERLDAILNLNTDILYWFDNMQNPVPKWYTGFQNLCFCGHDCFRCITFLATVKNDDELRKRSQQFYTDEFGLDISLSDIHCLGGRSADIFKLCRGCPWMKCCKEKGLSACSDCTEYPCKPLKEYQGKYVNKCNQI